MKSAVGVVCKRFARKKWIKGVVFSRDVVIAWNTSSSSETPTLTTEPNTMEMVMLMDASSSIGPSQMRMKSHRVPPRATATMADVTAARARLYPTTSTMRQIITIRMDVGVDRMISYPASCSAWYMKATPVAAATVVKNARSPSTLLRWLCTLAPLRKTSTHIKILTRIEAIQILL